MRTIGVVTVARSDYGIYLPILHRIVSEPELQLSLYVSGMHLSPEFGHTVSAIEQDGFEIAERVEMLLSSDTPEAVAKSMGLGVIGFAQAFARQRPDLLLVLGDRFEMYAAALAALPFKIPIAHIHGGEVTEGAMDEALRHGITKLSHLHFVSTEVYARRVRQLGEEPWRITVAGAPALDNLDTVPLLSKTDLESALGFALEKPCLIVTFHPATLQFEQAEAQLRELLAAVEAADAQAIFTLPNADMSGRAVLRLIQDFLPSHPRARLVENLGTQRYFSLMSQASAMIGNSSSGIIEAPSFELPVVNVGLRQSGRERAANVIDVLGGSAAILNGIRKALSREFRGQLAGTSNPYRQPRGAAPIIVENLAVASLDERLLMKKFHDLPGLGEA